MQARRLRPWLTATASVPRLHSMINGAPFSSMPSESIRPPFTSPVPYSLARNRTPSIASMRISTRSCTSASTSARRGTTSRRPSCRTASGLTPLHSYRPLPSTQPSKIVSGPPNSLALSSVRHGACSLREAGMDGRRTGAPSTADQQRKPPPMPGCSPGAGGGSFALPNRQEIRRASVGSAPRIADDTYIACTDKRAGQAPFATGSRIATHSTWWVIGKRSKTRRVRTL